MTLNLLDSDGTIFKSVAVTSQVTVGSDIENSIRIRLNGLAPFAMRVAVADAGKVRDEQYSISSDHPNFNDREFFDHQVQLEALGPGIEVGGNPVPEGETVLLHHADMIRCGPTFWMYLVESLPAPAIRAEPCLDITPPASAT